MPRVLLVDDDKDLLRISQRYLKREEPTYEFITIESAHEALQALEMTHFDAIVADYQMPEMDGLELLEQLRREGNAIPFIIFTGRGREEVAIRALNLGADYYLRKGGESKSLFGELAHIIKQLVQHQHTEQALHEARSHAQKYLDIAAVMIVAINSDGTVNLINQKGCAILGYSEEEIIGKNWFDTFLPLMIRDEVQAVFLELMRGNIEPVEYFENPIITKSGEERTVAWHNTILTENDRIIGTLSSGGDITERKQAEEELRESKKRFATIFENAYDGIVNLDESGKILDVNRKALQLYAGSKAELLGKNFLELDVFSLKDKTDLIKYFEQLSSGQTGFLEISIKNKEGQVFDLECSGSPVVLNDRALGAAVFIRDITARKEEMERALQISEKRYRELFGHMSSGVAVYEAVDNGTNFIFADLNQAGEIISEIRKEEILGRRVTEIFPGVKEIGLLEIFQRVWKTGIPERHPTSFYKDQRVASWVENAVYKLPSGELVAVYDNVTARQQAEEALQKAHNELEWKVEKRTKELRESEEQYRTLVEEAPQGITIWQDDSFVFVNAAFAKMTGHTREELISFSFNEAWNMVYPDDQASVLNAMQGQMTGTPPEEYLEHRFIQKNGQLRWVRVTATTIKYKGKPALQTLYEDRTEEKQAEKALKTSNSWLESIFRAAPTGIGVVCDRVLTDFNDRFCEIVGYSSEELLGQNAIMVYPSREEYEWVGEEKYRQISEHGIGTVETRLKRKDGQLIDVLLSSAPLDLSDFSKGVTFTALDITERKLAEEQLQASEERYRELVEKMHEGVLVEDADSIITFVNRRAAKMLGYSKAELIDQPLSILAPESENEKIKEEFAKRQRGLSSIYETSIRAKDDRLIPAIISTAPLFSSTGAFQGALSVFTDITDRKRAETTLRQSEAKYYDLYESAPVAYFSVDTDGVIKQANKAAQNFTGYQLDELQGMKASSLYTKKSQAKASELLAKFKQGIPWANEEIIYQNKDGQEVYGLLSVSPITDENGHVLESRSVVVDVTKRKRLEVTLLRQKEELSDIAHAMAHDLRNRLIAIEGYAALLKKRHDKGYVEKISSLAKNMNELLYRSVTLADAGLVIEKIDVVELTLLVQEVAESVIPDNVSFRHDSLPTVRGDRHKLAQVFQNLFENAVTHGKPRKIEVRRRDTKDSTRIWITNDGTPIPSENRSKIFQRGFTTKVGGTGLGLTIAQRVIEAHDWQIRLEDTPGTTFSIVIPSEAK